MAAGIHPAASGTAAGQVSSAAVREFLLPLAEAFLATVAVAVHQETAVGILRHRALSAAEEMAAFRVYLAEGIQREVRLAVGIRKAAEEGAGLGEEEIPIPPAAESSADPASSQEACRAWAWSVPRRHTNS